MSQPPWVPEITELMDDQYAEYLEYVDLIRSLARDFRDLDYRVDTVGALLGEQAGSALDREEAIPARRRVAQLLDQQLDPLNDLDTTKERDRNLAAIISLWMLGDPVPQALIDEALPRIGGSAGVTQLGLARTGPGGLLYPLVDLSPYATDDLGDLWVASDQTALQLRSPLPADHVLGIGHASLTLASLVPRHRVKRALDVGVGCGIQTFHLLAHADHVTATDISQDALDFTRFNLLLNSRALKLDPQRIRERVELRLGSMLEPVAGEKFDLVVSNPPFVIAPPAEDDPHTYRSTTAGGDAITAELITGVHEVLTDDPGAQAVLMANWQIPEGADWQTRPRQWAENNGGLDTWVIQRDHQDPAGYAETWLRDSSDQLDPEKYATGYRNYLDYFEAEQVAGIGFGWVKLVRSAGPQLIRLEEYRDPVIQPVAEAWQNSYRVWRDLSANGDVMVTEQPELSEKLTPTYLTVPHHVTREQYQHFGAEDPETLIARSGGGFCRSVVLDTATAAVLSVSDGELTAGQIVAAVSGLLELDEQATAQLWRAIGRLVIDGFVVPTGQQ